ncbi:unnamed protein product, partial [Meganyctiphanes norvegica]
NKIWYNRVCRYYASSNKTCEAREKCRWDHPPLCKKEDACSGELCGKLHIENLQFDKWRNQEIINPYSQEKIKIDESEKIEHDNINKINPSEKKIENKKDNTNEEIEQLIGANALPTNQEWEDMPIWDDNVYTNQNRKKQKNNEILVNICTFHAIGECRYGKD